MAYQQFPIYDLRSGLRLEKEPWLTTADGFRSLDNIFINRGVMEKRRGLGTFGRLIHHTEAVLNGASGTISTTLPIVPGTFTIVHGAETLTDDGAGVLTGDVSLTGTINYTTGAWTTSGVLTNGHLDFDWYPGEEVMGLYRHRSASAETLLAVDTKRVNKYNTVTSLFEDVSTRKLHFTSGSTGLAATATITGSVSGATATVDYVEVTSGTLAGDDAAGIIHISDQIGTFQSEKLLIGAVDKATISTNSSMFELTGDDTNFVWFDTWNNITYLTNNKDPIQRYDGTRIRQLNIDLVTSPTGGPLNHINSALMVINFKSRVLLFSTNESGTTYRQRVRYSNANSDQKWDPDDYVDCSTSDWITGARFVGDQLVVTFSHSVWRLVYTGDSDLPFRWERISDEYGGVSPFSMVSFDRRVEILGETELTACFDALEVKRMDRQIPDFVLDTTMDSIEYSYSAKIEELKQVWMTYTSSNSTDGKPDKVLVRNYDDNTFATADFTGLGIHCLGFFRWETSPTWDGLPAALGLPSTVTVDEINVPFAFRQAQAGFPILLLGNRSGYVYQYSVTYADLGTNFTVNTKSGQWNPFIYNGKKANLGFIDFFVDNIPNATITVNVYLDDEITPSYTLTVSCESTIATDLMKIARAYLGDAGAVANFFTLELVTTDAYKLRIHAVAPYFKPAGRANFGG